MANLYALYSALDRELKKLEEEKETLRSQIISDLQSQSVDKVETDYGTFTVAHRVSYTYTDKVKALEEKVKLAKVKEEQKGLAEAKETQYLRYTV